MMAPMTESSLARVYMVTADLALDTEIGDVDVVGNQDRLVGLLKTYLTERGFTVDRLVKTGLMQRKGREPGGPNSWCGDIMVVVHGNAEDIERALDAFSPPKHTYPRIWWVLVTNETLAARSKFLADRKAHSDKLRSKGLATVAPTAEQIAARSRDGASGGAGAGSAGASQTGSETYDGDVNDLF